MKFEREQSSSYVLKVDQRKESISSLNNNQFIAYYQKAIEDYLMSTYSNIPEVYSSPSVEIMNLEFFYPLIFDKEISIFEEYLELHPNNQNQVKLNDMINKQKINFYIENTIQKIYGITKNTEINFGIDTDNSLKNQNTMHSFLNEFIQMINSKFNHLSKDEFYRHYQLFLAFSKVIDHPRDLVIVLFPRRNLKLENDFYRFQTILNNKLINKYDAYKVRKIYWEDLIEYVKKNIHVDNINLLYQMNEFTNKYFS